MPGWMNHKLDSTARRNINNLRYADYTTLMTESEEELKSLLMRMKKLAWSSAFKKLRSWHLSPFSWQIDGETMKTLTDFIFLSSKITADSDCSHEIKWCSLLGRKSVTNLDTLPTKVSLVKVMVFSVVTCGYEIWTIKKAERWRIDAFTCGAGEDSWESFGQQQDQTSQS